MRRTGVITTETEAVKYRVLSLLVKHGQYEGADLIYLYRQLTRALREPQDIPIFGSARLCVPSGDKAS
jgi:hypothetical protein